jgi:bile acid:Na+ symporter, BASS family
MRETLLPIFTILLKVCIPLAAFATGLGATRADPLWLARRPGLLVRSLLAILIVVPVAAGLFLHLIHAPQMVRDGLLITIMAIGIGPPAAFKRTKAHGESISFEIGLNVLLLVIAIVYIPTAVAIHGAVYHHDLRLAPGRVASVVLSRALIPLALGVLVGRLAPRVVTPLSRYAGAFVQGVLLLLIAVALLVKWRSLIDLGASAWLTTAAIALGEIVVGHLAGGPARDTRRVLAAFSSMRFPALALLLASLAPRGSSRLIPVILAYVITSAVLLAFYGALMDARERRGGVPHPRPARTAPAPAPAHAGRA